MTTLLLKAMIRVAILLAAFAQAPVLARAPAALHHDLALRLDPGTRTLEARDVLTLPAGGTLQVVLDARFTVDAASLEGRPLAEAARRPGVRRWEIPAADAPRRLEIAWRGVLDPLEAGIDHRATLSRRGPVADVRGSFLPSSGGWYPSVPGRLESYRLAIELPPGQKGLVAGRLVEERDDAKGYAARFEFSEPAEGIDLMAGPYRVEERRVSAAQGRALRLRTYLHPEVAGLAVGYLADVERYIRLYEDWIGAYPFDGFSVVSSPTPTGFGMPTLTYLGIDVIRLPFIRATSLGHEVLHNWWGNGVYPDYAQGNWSEGLTTFMADYAYKEREGEAAAREMRLAWLRDLAAVPPGQDRPLVEFTSRTHGTSQVVGYNKPAMLFFMLRDRIGTAAFDRGIRRFWADERFKVAGWDALERAFERVSGEDLSRFFGQWLRRSGLPAVRIERVSAEAGGKRVRVVLAQDAPAYALRVPLRFDTAAGAQTRVAELTEERAEVAFDLDMPSAAVALDPELRLLRRLAPGEAPPILRTLSLDPATELLVLSAELQAQARALAARLLDHTARDHAGGAVPLLVFGLQPDVERWLAREGLAVPPELERAASLKAWTAVRGDGRSVAVVSARDAAALEQAARALPHYGRQSWVVFEAGRATARGVWPSVPQTVPMR